MRSIVPGPIGKPCSVRKDANCCRVMRGLEELMRSPVTIRRRFPAGDGTYVGDSPNTETGLSAARYLVDQLRKLLERVALLVSIGMPVVDSPDAGDDVADRTLRNVSRDASARHQ